MIKVIDESELKFKNKVRDDSLEKHLKSCDPKKVSHVNVIRSAKGEVLLWETHHIKELKEQPIIKDIVEE
tara:strand:+ start:902 stop:1111 length:210 start_codon:yes stop_codon:yes gene_type:complete